MTLLATAIAVLMSATIWLWTAARCVRGRLNLAEDLPLGICNFTAFIAPLQAMSGSPMLTAWSICVGGPAGLVSLLAPDVGPRHPLETHVKFWVVHIGLVAHALLLATLHAPVPHPELLLQLMGMMAAIGLAALGANARLCANYLFLRSKPANASPLDWFGQWPRYLAPMSGMTAAAILGTFAAWSLAWH